MARTFSRTLCAGAHAMQKQQPGHIILQKPSTRLVNAQVGLDKAVYSAQATQVRAPPLHRPQSGGPLAQLHICTAARWRRGSATSH
jgi:hypothetical protein